MPWRLIIFIVIFAVFLIFISLNLETVNRCDINFGFFKLDNVPVFITIFVSFILGILSSIPLIFYIRKKYITGDKKEKKIDKKKDKKDEADDVPLVIAADEKIKEDAAKAKKRFFEKRKGSD